MRCYVLQPFLGRLVRISLHQANFSPFNIVHKIDDRKAYFFYFSFNIYIAKHRNIHGLETNICN